MDNIHVLLTMRFTQAQLDRVRAVSQRLVVEQKSIKEGSDFKPLDTPFSGNEEVLYCSMPPHDLSVLPHLKWVQLHSAGINHLAGHPILQSNVHVTTNSGTHATPIGEFTIGMMLALARKLPLMVRKQERAEWPKDKWNLFLGSELRGKTLGSIGYGSIAREVARLAKVGFGMRVVTMTRSGEKRDRGYHEPGIGDPEGTLPEAWFSQAQLLDLLAQSDFVLVAAPLTEETRNLIGERELRAMKSTAFLINIARGGIIAENILIRALREKWIAGAGLDVFEKEPLPAESELWKLDNVFISPHASAATPHYDDRATQLFCENLRRYLRGDELLNLVSKDKGY
jgi:phosphoglycerate dehydrogenase-like enzyme